MKQIIQDMKSGRTVLEEVPVPQVKSGYVLVKTSCSLVSLGTERMLVEFGKANLIDKARQQPDKVKQVLDKIKTDGLQPTLEAVFNKLGQPLPLGYCNSGVVVAVGNGVTEVKVGDRVASNGQHAEYVCVPKNLVAKIPENVSDEEKKAAKTVVKESQKKFVADLASLGDCWINDAFGTAHRAHASTALIAKYFPNDKMFGYVMEGELKAVDSVMKHPQRPFTAIMGGSKVSSKIDIIMNLMDKVDNLILGGGMTYTFKAALGGHVGSSICETDKLDLALDIMRIAKEKGVNLVLSNQAVIGDAFSNEAHTQVCDPMNIPDGWEGLDIGPETRKRFAEVIENSKTILWNGPVGVFEIPKFAEGTKAIAEAIVKATENGAFSLIGGGDSVAAINQFGLADKVSYVSTGGGALLEYIEGKELPGVSAVCGE